MIRFGLALLVCALVVGGLTYFASDQQWISELPSFFWQTQIILVFMTTVIFGYLFRLDKPEFFIQLYLLTMVMKLLGYGAYNFLMIRQDQDGAGHNVAFFMVLYVLFTGIEIAFLYRKISRSGSR